MAEVCRCIRCIRDGEWPRRLNDVEELEVQIVEQYQKGELVEGPPMTDAHVALVMLLLFITAIFLGFPIAFTLLALAFIFGWYAMGERIVSLIATNSGDVMTNDVLVAIPLFLFMGYMVERANILDRLFRSDPGRRPRRAGLAGAWRRWSPARCSPPPPASSVRWSR